MKKALLAVVLATVSALGLWVWFVRPWPNKELLKK